MAEAVAMEGIVKRFPGVLANDDVDLMVERGEIRAIVGENGAGKTTLMRILYGLETPDAGTIRVKGDKVTIPHARTAIALGIGMVHQHFKLVPSFTVAQNVVLGMEPQRGIVYDEEAAKKDVLQLSERYGLAVDPDRKIIDASVGEQQRVEILRALYRKADILILDEPTAVLTDSETEELFSILRRLAEDGLTILFISHKLREVLAISDNTTVMRDGRVVGTVKTAQTSDRELSEMIIGRETLESVLRDRKLSEPGAPVLELDGVSVYDSRSIMAVKSVALTVHSGEILGIAGVEGNGQVELAEAITGLRPTAEGRILLLGREIQNLSVRQIREAGVAHIPADRNAMGVAVNALVWEHSPHSDDTVLKNYKIYRRLDTESKLILLATVTKNVSSYNDTNLSTTEKYIYSIKATDKYMEASEYSLEVREIEVFAPIQITLETKENKLMFHREKINYIGWAYNPLNDARTIAYYRVYRKKKTDSDSTFEEIIRLDADKLEYIDRGLTFEHDYAYAVTCLDELWNESPLSIIVEEE